MIQTAVYSHRTSSQRNILDLAALALWVLSVRHARRHFTRLVLFTDRHGAALLVDGLGLPFDEVQLFAPEDAEFPNVWALGKLRAYSRMREPFLHVDHDVILWKPLPSELLAAPVSALMREACGLGDRQYPFYPMWFLDGLPNVPDWVRAMANAEHAHAYNMGIFGANDLDFVGRYCAESFASLRDPGNAPVIAQAHGTTASVFLEQYWLAAYARLTGQPITTLITEDEQADRHERRCRELGFTHLWGTTKTLPPYRDLILLRCQAHFSHDFLRCQALTHSTTR